MREAKKATNPDCNQLKVRKPLLILNLFEVYTGVSQECGYADHRQKIPKPCLSFLLFIFLSKEGEKGKK